VLSELYGGRQAVIAAYISSASVLNLL